MSLEKYFFKYHSSKSGLSAQNVLKNRATYGSNSLTFKKRDGLIQIMLQQFGSFFSILLTCAAAILFIFGEYLDFYIVLAIIIVNVTIESIQRYRSDALFESLTKTLPSFALVLRDGKKTKVESSEVTVGDVVLLSAGDKVPADGIIIHAQDFKVDEALLTGESKPVQKEASDTFDPAAVTDNPSAVFSGTYVVTGTAQILVIAVGNETQIGIIASKITTVDTELPIHKNVRKLSFNIFIFVLVLSFLVLIIGIIQMQSWSEILKITVALFVSAIPESLPVMLTLILAYGFKRMGDKNVLVRKMQSLDVLGQINVLALDKTGTITRNQMKVEKLYTPDGVEQYVSGDGYSPNGGLIYREVPVLLSEYPGTQKLVESLVLTSDGMYEFDERKQDWTLETGDPTEVALLVLGHKLAVTKEDLFHTYTLKQNIPFNNQKMYHEVLYMIGKKEVSFFSGAPEVILAMCDYACFGGSVKKLNDATCTKIHEKIKEYSMQGYRVIANCTKEGKKYILTGLVAMSDSIRTDVTESVAQVYARGVDILIITGDHKEIALQVAKNIGLKCNASTILTGGDMANLNDNQLRNSIVGKNIFARVSPQQKLKILELLKKSGKIVAMTGDGVNDSLALVKADIGIAMGKASSEAAKEASDIVLLDDKFGSIVYGIEEGKNIFSNIRKTILFLLSTNFAEMFVVVLALMLALPLPLSAIAILWLNLVTDTFLVVGFAFERGVTERRMTQKLLTFKEWARIIYLGLIMTFVALFVFLQSQDSGMYHAQAMALLVLIIMQWMNVFNIRAGEQSIFRAQFSTNKAFTIGWIISLVLTILAFHTAFMRDILNIDPVTLGDWVYAFVLGSLIIWFEELRKWARNIRLFVRK